MPIARPSSPLAPDFEILVNGSPLSVEQETHAIAVIVDKDLNLPSMFALEFIGSATRATQFEWIDDMQLFTIGNEIEIRMGYADDLEKVMIGEITGLEPEFVIDRSPGVTVRGYDRRHRLQRDRKTRTFIQQKDSDIAARIASEANLTARVTDTQVVHDYVVQANETDLAFLQERARLIQYEVFVEDKTLFFQPVANAESEIVTLTLEQDLLAFYPRLTSMHQISEVTVHGWNPKEKESIVGQARNGDEVSKMGGQNSGAALIESAFGAANTKVIARPIATQAEADQLAKAKFNQKLLELISGEGVCRGRTDLQPGKVIALDGFGKRFSGKYYLTSVTHRYRADRGYYTDFKVRRNAV